MLKRTLLAMLALPGLAVSVIAHAHGRQGEVDPFIHQQAAKERAEQVSSISYSLDFDISQPDVLIGLAEVGFVYSPAQGAGEPLVLDFRAKEVRSVEVNGVAFPVADVYQAANEKLLLPASALLADAANSVKVAYVTAYSSGGDQTGLRAGLYRREDTDSGETYVFTRTEPFGSHRYFPCFDQPDLRADFALNLTLPKGWTAVSAESAEEVLDAPGGVAGLQRIRFAPTVHPISTYLFSFAAGPFQVAESSYRDMPLRLYYPSSAKANLDPARVLRTTVVGMEFFEETLQIKYPFSKYDQVILFKEGGGMEHVGATLLGDSLFTQKDLYLTAVSEETWLHYSNNVILHELAHAWFGNLVTMTWWDDLWLKESFATYLAYLAAGKVDDQTIVDREFARGVEIAMQSDRDGLAGPIQREFQSSEGAALLYDTITYDKGAAVLRIFHGLLGDGFFTAVTDFLNANSYGSSGTQDFLAALNQVAGKDFSSVFNPWITTAGLDEVSVDYSCSGGAIDSFNVLKKALKGSPDRLQQIDLALFGDQPGAEALLEKTVFATGAVTAVPELIGGSCPLFVYGNAAGRGYFDYRFDGKSVAAGIKSFAGLPDPGLRKTFFDFVNREAFAASASGINPRDVLDLVFGNWLAENDEDVIRIMRVEAYGIMTKIRELSKTGAIKGALRVYGPRYRQGLEALYLKHQDNPQLQQWIVPDYLTLVSQQEYQEFMASGKIGDLDFSTVLASDPTLKFFTAMDRPDTGFDEYLAGLEEIVPSLESLPFYYFIDSMMTQLRKFGPPDQGLKLEAIDAALAFDSLVSGQEQLSGLFRAIFPTDDMDHLRPEALKYALERFQEFQAKNPSFASQYLAAFLPRRCSDASRAVYADALLLNGLHPVAVQNLTERLAIVDECLAEKKAIIRDFQ